MKEKFKYTVSSFSFDGTHLPHSFVRLNDRGLLTKGVHCFCNNKDYNSIAEKIKRDSSVGAIESFEISSTGILREMENANSFKSPAMFTPYNKSISKLESNFFWENTVKFLLQKGMNDEPTNRGVNRITYIFMDSKSNFPSNFEFESLFGKLIVESRNWNVIFVIKV